MAWRCSGTTNHELVSKLAKAKLITNPLIKQAMEATDRALYCRTAWVPYAYEDRPLPISEEATISAPHMHAYALQLLEDHLKPGNRVLDVGSGSGYLLACMAEMLVPDPENIVPNTKVVGIEYVEEVYAFGKNNIEQKSERMKRLVQKGVIELIRGDGWKGYPQSGPYHAIHVGAAAATLPQALVEQLAPGGRMVIPVGEWSQDLMVIDKDVNGKVKKQSVMGVMYVPLVNPNQSQ
ncbi:hypothetical protein C9374_002394 [Naegleria lovaniensis]|uniref:Protein-L-isoaspartate O-methyltransferase n=1 Tax=Naegleria lovaniensis TaxID=51637 RepID=A0AA88KKD2_NAELO|nr:uncharacterized protein C9374_002394 [Naegleria lovaniensis]KAG2386650.1 hypothetical protein C9374_002394 [Naegleria lovaniensis]